MYRDGEAVANHGLLAHSAIAQGDQSLQAKYRQLSPTFEYAE